MKTVEKYLNVLRELLISSQAIDRYFKQLTFIGKSSIVSVAQYNANIQDQSHPKCDSNFELFSDEENNVIRILMTIYQTNMHQNSYWMQS